MVQCLRILDVNRKVDEGREASRREGNEGGRAAGLGESMGWGVLEGGSAGFNKIATQGAPQMAVDKEANSLSRVYSYYSKFNLRLFYV